MLRRPDPHRSWNVFAGMGVAFYNHSGLLSFYSTYFDAALNGRFKESKTGVICLATEDPATYSRFEKWLYHGSLPDLDLDHTRPPDFLSVIDLWLFADSHGVPLLANTCIDRLRDLIVAHWVLPTGEMRYIYSHTLPISPLRRCVVDIFARVWRESEGAATVHGLDFTEEIWRDVAMALLPRPKQLTRCTMDRMLMCEWHVHPKGVWCRNERLGLDRERDERATKNVLEWAQVGADC